MSVTLAERWGYKKPIKEEKPEPQSLAERWGYGVPEQPQPAPAPLPSAEPSAPRDVPPTRPPTWRRKVARLLGGVTAAPGAIIEGLASEAAGAHMFGGPKPGEYDPGRVSLETAEEKLGPLLGRVSRMGREIGTGAAQYGLPGIREASLAAGAGRAIIDPHQTLGQRASTLLSMPLYLYGGRAAQALGMRTAAKLIPLLTAGQMTAERAAQEYTAEIDRKLRLGQVDDAKRSALKEAAFGAFTEATKLGAIRGVGAAVSRRPAPRIPLQVERPGPRRGKDIAAYWKRGEAYPGMRADRPHPPGTPGKSVLLRPEAPETRTVWREAPPLLGAGGRLEAKYIARQEVNLATERASERRARQERILRRTRVMPTEPLEKPPERPVPKFAKPVPTFEGGESYKSLIRKGGRGQQAGLLGAVPREARIGLPKPGGIPKKGTPEYEAVKARIVGRPQPERPPVKGPVPTAAEVKAHPSLKEYARKREMKLAPEKAPPPPLPPKAAKSLRMGAKTEIRAPGEKEGRKARYAVVDLDDLQPSHKWVGETLQRNPKFQGFQPREYRTGSAEYETARKIGRAPDTGELLSETTFGQSGPSVIAPDGTLIAGNGRTLGLKRADAGGKLKGYYESVRQRAITQGLNVKGVKKPVLVRVVAEHAQSPAARRLAEATNIATTTAQPVIESARRARAAGPLGKEILESLHLEKPEAGKPLTFREAVKHPTRGRMFRDTLRNDTPAGERPMYFSEKGLTPAGEAYAEARLLLEAYPAETVKRLQSSRASLAATAAQTLPQVLKLKRDYPTADVTKPLSEALDFLGRHPGIKSPAHVKDTLGQTVLFGEAESLSPKARLFADWLVSKPKGGGRTFGESPAKAREVFGKALVEMGQPLLSGGRSPEQILREAIGEQFPEPPGLGVTAQLGGRSVTKRQLQTIHMARQNRGMGLEDDAFRRMVGQVSAKGITRTKELSGAEASRLIQMLRPSVKLKSPKTEQKALFETGQAEAKLKAKALKVGEKRRLPPIEEVAQFHEDQKTALQEVQTFSKPRRVETPGMVEKPVGVLRRAGRAVSDIGRRITKHYRTVIEELGPKGGKLRKIMHEDLKDATDNTQARKNAAEGLLQEHLATSGTKWKTIKRWRTKQETLTLPSGKTLRATPAELADIAWMRKDPYGRDAMRRQGITFRKGPADPVRLNGPDAAAADRYLTENHPKLASFLDFAFRWSNGPGADQVARAFWRDTGKKLEVTGSYTSLLRDIRRLRGIKADLSTPEAQEARYLVDLLGGLKGAKANASSTFRTYVPEGELGGISILQERVGSKAPLVAQDVFVKFGGHVNRVARYSGMAVAVRNSNSLVNHPDFQRAIRQRYGKPENVLHDLRYWIRAKAGLDVQPKSMAARIIGPLVRNIQRSVLSRLHIAAYQPVSYLNAWASGEIDAKYLFAPDVLAPKLSRAARNAENAEIKKYVPGLYARRQGSAHSIMTPSITPHMEAEIKRMYGGGRPLRDLSLEHIRRADDLTMTRLWRASKKMVQSETNLTGEKMLREAARHYSRIADTQPTWDPMNMNILQLEGRKNPWEKMLVLFTAQRSVNLNMAMRAVNEYRHSPRNPIAKYKMLKGLLVPTVVNAALVHGIREGAQKLYGYNYEQSWFDHAADIIENACSGVVVVTPAISNARRITQQVLGGKSAFFLQPRHNPLTETIDSGYKGFALLCDTVSRYLSDQEISDKQLAELSMRLIRLTGRVSGTPLEGIEHMVKPTVRKLTKKPRRGLPKLPPLPKARR